MKILFSFVLIALEFLIAPAAYAAEPFPSKSLRLIVPFPPGGATDNILRLVGQKLGERLNQTVIIDNKPGGGTVLATDLAAKAPADGYTPWQ